MEYPSRAGHMTLQTKLFLISCLSSILSASLLMSGACSAYGPLAYNRGSFSSCPLIHDTTCHVLLPQHHTRCDISNRIPLVLRVTCFLRDLIDGFNPPHALGSACFVAIVIQYLPHRVFFFFDLSPMPSPRYIH